MKHRIILSVIAVLASTVILGILLIFNGMILLNNPTEMDYPVRGVDVSAYQGTIDWQILASQNIDFAFIKATEGSSFVDQQFTYNLISARQTNLRVGAYHFFSYDSSGITQAENFIETVPIFDGMLPPVIDLEFYGDKEKNPPSRNEVHKNLNQFISDVEAHYGMKPVFYATEKSYQLYLANAYEEYDIWIRNVLTSPTLSDGRNWTFWQYTNRAVLPGYQGKERFIDVNVFYGSKNEFAAYAIP